MADIIDLTASPQPEVIEISSDQGDTPPGRHARTPGNEKRTRKRKKSNGASKASAQPSRSHSLEIADKSSGLDACTPHPKPARRSSLPPAGEPGLFFVDGAAAPLAVVQDGSPPEPAEPDHDDSELLLPSHVTVFHDNGSTPAQVIPPPKPSSGDEEYTIEYLEYEDRKAPGLVRYFEVEGEESNQSKSSIFKCKNCGAEGKHKTYECPVQICLTCGARDEHSTRSCPISKTCYTCGMKGHINKTCPNRFSAYTASSDFHGDCDRCGSTEHGMNECPTLWRIYQYVNDEERVLIMQYREQKNRLAIGEGGEGYIGGEMWCYNCANAGHLGDDCDELPHPATFPTEYSAFSFHNIVSGPFYDPDTELVSFERRRRERESGIDRAHLPDDWDADAPVDVGRRGKNKDKERLEKRFREQEDEGENWFDDIRNAKKRGMGQQAPPSAPGGRTLKFGSLKDGGSERSSPPAPLPTSGSGLSLLARLSDPREGRTRVNGRDRHEPHREFEHSIRIRGAATEQRKQADHANAQRTERERGQASQDRRKRDKAGWHRESRQHGPRYKGDYDR